MRRFRLNPEEQRGLLLLILLILAIVIYRTTRHDQAESLNGEPTDSDIRSALPDDEGQSSKNNLAPFDPNTADSLTLISYGLTPWQVRNMMKYRAKGGYWRDAADFRRLYELTDEQYQRLLPYIRITPREKDVNFSVRRQYSADSTYKHYPKQEKYAAGTRIDPNTADTAEWKHIPGIGSYYSKKICEYRERLGGFVDGRQMCEIEGLPEGIEKWVKVEPGYQPRRLSINHATFRQLIRHPYLNYEQTRSIVNYRNKYGPLRSFRALSLDSNFTQTDFDRLRPYIDWRE